MTRLRLALVPLLLVFLGSCAPHGTTLPRAAPDPALLPLLERLAKDPDDVSARLDLAEARRTAGDLEGALLEAYKALASDPRSARAHVVRAHVYFDRGLPDKEIEAWRAALALAPSRLDLQVNLGHALLAGGQLEAAAVQYRAVLEQKPNAEVVLFNLARIATDLGQRAEALKLWARYLELDSSSSWADQAREAVKLLSTKAGP